MKRLFLSIVMIASALGFARADEGMWTLMNLPQAVYDKMKEEGYQLEYGKLYHDKDAIYNAVVNFGGFCSGVVVSPDGLVFTNHHCGFEAIRANSTVEHDYMKDGFVANSFEEELPNKNLFVAFMVAQKDVTAEVEAGGFREFSNEDKQKRLNEVEEAANQFVKKMNPNFYAELKPYYERNNYYIDVYQAYSDVRLVFAVPKSMGKFGGETDNWMWPRQTCDFSVFRIYADKETNGPANYSKENVPYKPKKWAQVSLQGYKEGDFAMTMGYPGSTDRYLSSFGIREMRDAQNLPRWQTREVKQKVMLKHMRADQAVRIKYDSKYAQSSNYWKNSIGMNKCIDSLKIIELKQGHEAKIKAYMDSTGYLKDKLDFDKMASIYEKRFRVMYAMYLFMETFGADELTRRANRYKEEGITYKDNSDTWDLATDKEMLVVLLKNYAEKADQEYMPEFFQTIKKKFRGNYKKYVDALYKRVLMKNDVEIKYDESTQTALLIAYAKDLRALMKKVNNKLSEESKGLSEFERYLCAAKLRMEQDMPHYSDANFTLRMSYGQVGGFDQYGRPSGYYTTPASIIAKMKQADKNFEYFAEPVMHELFSQKDFGKYNDSVTGTLNLCFLTNNDITGGNSGSPVFDGQNRLIGLAFDGNWESLSADIFFDSNLARCICVDIRYMLFMMEKWGKADRLIKEINAQ